MSVRDIQVIIAGNVFSPGPYTLNGNSTLFHALAISGGPSEDGSFRQIDLVRGGKVIETADFYETFINGASKKVIQKLLIAGKRALLELKKKFSKRVLI